MKPTTFLVACTALALAVAGCGSAGSVSGAGGEALRVVVGFYPLQFLAERIGGDGTKVSSLAQPGAEPHDLELTPQQIAQVAGADVVLYLGGFQPAVDDAVAQNAEDSAFDVLGATDVTAEPGENGESGPDPHVWLDPTRYAEIAGAVADRMAEADPGNAKNYHANGVALGKDLTALDEEFRTGLEDCDRAEIVTTHDAFGYLAGRYDLEQVAIAGLSPDDEPSPQTLDEVRQFAEDHGVTTIFYEAAVTPEYAETVAEQVGADTAVLSPVEVVDDGEDYLSVMRSNLATLQDALGCG